MVVLVCAMTAVDVSLYFGFGNGFCGGDGGRLVCFLCPHDVRSYSLQAKRYLASCKMRETHGRMLSCFYCSWRGSLIESEAGQSHKLTTIHSSEGNQRRRREGNIKPR